MRELSPDTHFNIVRRRRESGESVNRQLTKGAQVIVAAASTLATSGIAGSISLIIIIRKFY
jgi:hypothetical protein